MASAKLLKRKYASKQARRPTYAILVTKSQGAL